MTNYTKPQNTKNIQKNITQQKLTKFYKTAHNPRQVHNTTQKHNVTQLYKIDKSLHNFITLQLSHNFTNNFR